MIPHSQLGRRISDLFEKQITGIKRELKEVSEHLTYAEQVAHALNILRGETQSLYGVLILCSMALSKESITVQRDRKIKFFLSHFQVSVLNMLKSVLNKSRGELNPA